MTNDKFLHNVNLSQLAREIKSEHEKSWAAMSEDQKWHLVRVAVLSTHIELLGGESLSEVVNAVLEEGPLAPKFDVQAFEGFLREDDVWYEFIDDLAKPLPNDARLLVVSWMLAYYLSGDDHKTLDEINATAKSLAPEVLQNIDDRHFPKHHH